MTNEFGGTLKFTKEFGQICEFLPIVIFPTQTALVPIQTLSSIVGHPFFFPSEICPIVTPGLRLQLLPMVTFPFMIIVPV